MNQSLSLWLPSYEAVRENKPGSSSGAGAAAFDPVEVCPLLYTTRINCAKMLIELEEWDSAVKVRPQVLFASFVEAKSSLFSPSRYSLVVRAVAWVRFQLILTVSSSFCLCYSISLSQLLDLGSDYVAVSTNRRTHYLVLIKNLRMFLDSLQIFT